MMLTSDEIRLLLKELSFETVFEEDGKRLQTARAGYSADAKVSLIQTKLSIMAEIAGAREVRDMATKALGDG